MMERSDRKKIVHQEWEANYNARGHATVDESTTEFAGTRREADIVVRGLKALKAQVELAEAVGVKRENEKHRWNEESLGDAPTTGELTELIEQVGKPNFVADPIIETQFL